MPLKEFFTRSRYHSNEEVAMYIGKWLEINGTDLLMKGNF